MLLAGDIYDKPIPPADAVTLFDAFLTELARLQGKVFLISSNHDSPERLQFGQPSFGGEPHSHCRRIPWGTALCDRFRCMRSAAHLSYAIRKISRETASFFKEQKPEDFSELLGQLIQQTPICPLNAICCSTGFVTDATFAPGVLTQWHWWMQNVDPAVFAP